MKKVIKQSIIRAINKNEKLFNLYYRFFWKPKNNIDRCLSQINDNFDVVKFIQIGANDGCTNDPLYKYVKVFGWRGILVEPQKQAFNNLKICYKNQPHVKLINKAIDRQSVERALYKVGFSDQRWASGLASFKRENIQKHYDNGYIFRMAELNGVKIPEDKSKWISKEKVDCINFSELLEEENQEINLLMIDVEGYDYEILKLVDLNSTKPQVIIYEHYHLNQYDRKDAQRLLTQNGYEVKESEYNTISTLING